MKVLVVQSCPTLCNPVGDSPPAGLQPTRLLHPWDFPGKNIGVGCQSLLQGIFLSQGSNLGFLHCRWVLNCLSHQGSPKVLFTELCPTLCDPMDCSPPNPSPRYSPGKNTGVGSHSLLQGIFPTQGLNQGLQHCRQIIFHLSHQMNW